MNKVWSKNIVYLYLYNWFCEPKNLNICSVIDQNTKSPFSEAFSTKIHRKFFSANLLQNNPKNVHFLVKKVKKDVFQYFVQCQSQWAYYQVKKSFIYHLDPILGHPVHQFLPKPEFSDFTVISYGLPLSYEFWKYMSLCWSNLCFLANAPGGHGPYYFKYRSLLRCLYSTICGNKSWY